MTLTPEQVAQFMATRNYTPQQIAATVKGMYAFGFTCDSPRQTTRDFDNPTDKLAEDMAEVKETVGQLKESVNSRTSGLGEMRGNHQQLRQQVHTHQQLLTAGNNNGDDDNGAESAGEGATDDTGEEQTGVGAESWVGGKKNSTGYQISTADQLRRLNNANRRKFGFDEITDGPSAPNMAGQTGSIRGNSSNTGQVLDPGTVWVGNSSAPTADELTNIHRRVRERANDAINRLQTRHGTRPVSGAKHPHTLSEINSANRKTWGIK
jgi:hypothetical protein